MKFSTSCMAALILTVLFGPRLFNQMAASERIPSQATPNCGSHCGTERWSVKTLSDSDAEQVDLNLSHRIITTVHLLVSLAAPKSRPENGRLVPTETTVYGVQGRLIGFKLEKDRDFHLVLEDQQSNETMIAEIPNPDCSGVCASHAMNVITQARQAFVQACGMPTTRYKRLTRPVIVRVIGVGFFDYFHDQQGVAKNAIELHPVLGIAFSHQTGACGGNVEEENSEEEGGK